MVKHKREQECLDPELDLFGYIEEDCGIIESAAPAQSVTVTEVGLLFPDSTMIWTPNTWKGHSFATPEDREGVVRALSLTAADLSWPEAEFLDRYRWVERKATYEDFRAVALTEAPL